jgi:hypothetical protein
VKESLVKTMEGENREIEVPAIHANLAEQEAPSLQHNFKIVCPERQELVDQALVDLKNSFEILGIQNWELPDIEIKFENNPKHPARVQVFGNRAEIIFDARCATPEGEMALRQEGKEIPGIQQVLKHELAHIATWSVTGLSRQPAVRLLDEGWASMVENLGSSKSPDFASLAKETKANVVRGLKEEAAIYNRCFDLSKPISQLGDEKELSTLNSAEYEVGKALLLWIREKFGIEKMVEFIAKSPEPVRRNDESGGAIEQAAVDSSLHSTAQEYEAMFSQVIKGEIPPEKINEKGREWEGRQFQKALLETTGLKSIKEVETEFMKWIKE